MVMVFIQVRAAAGQGSKVVCMCAGEVGGK